MLIKFISYVPAIIGLLTIGLFVLLNNVKSVSNRIFSVLNLLLASWLLFLFIADVTNQNTVALWSLRLALVFGALVCLTFYYFALVFPFQSKINRSRQMIASFPVLLVAFLSLTSIIVPSVKLEDFGAQPTGINDLYTISDLIGIAYLIAGTIVLLFKYKRATLREKNQIRLILVGLSVAVFVNIFTGLFLTLLKVDTNAILLGSFSLFVFSLFVAYAILKHGFFDIRSVVARSAGYVLSLGTLITLTLLLVLGLSNIADKQNFSNSVQQLISAVIVVVLAISYQPLKRFFDSATNRIFYRDAYDSQALLNELNRSLVSTINLDEILKRSSNIINNTLKTEYVGFAIKDSQNRSIRLVGITENEINNDLVQSIALSTAHNAKIVVAEELDPAKHHIRDLMRQANISVFVMLEGKTGGKIQHPGYILLGQKRSGGLFSEQDIQVLETIADGLVLAIQNALSFKEIQQFNITLQEKIEAATKELRHTNAKLKALDEAKDEFISMASHQLRTPLTAIKGYLSMILDGDAGTVKPKQKEMMQQSFDGAQRMVYLISDLLNVSRLQTGKFVIDNQPANLAEMITGEMSQLKEQAAAKEIEMSYEKPTEFPILNIDETKVRQVIMNFLDNALYYTPKGGKVSVNLVANADSVEFTVKDTGVGVPKAVQHNLFTKFYRADNARKMRPDGTGLGLFMAKKVIVAQGGAIIFNSVEGQGSTFGFSLPRATLEVTSEHKPLKGGGASMPIRNPL